MTSRTGTEWAAWLEENQTLVWAEVQRLLPPGFSIENLAPAYWRPKGEEGTILSFRCDLRASDGARTRRWVTLRRAATERLRTEVERCTDAHVQMAWPLPPCELHPENAHGLFVFPFDRRLPRLATQLRPRSLVRMLEQGPYGRSEIEKGWRIRKRHSHWEVASYRPERRVVLRWVYGEKNDRTGAKRQTSVFVRIHAHSLEVPEDLHARLAATGIPAPALLAAPDATIRVESAVPGHSPPFDRVPPLNELERVGRLIARWHRDGDPAGLRPRDPGALLQQAESSLATLALADPDRARSLHARLEELKALDVPVSSWVALHGDLHPGQWSSDGAQIFLLDWDRACGGSAASDLATLALHLGVRSGSLRSPALRALRAGYESVHSWPRPAEMLYHLEAARLRLCDLGYRRPGSVSTEWVDFLFARDEEAAGGTTS